MKKRMLSLVGVLALSIAALFSATGSYLFLNKPRMPRELARKDAK